MEAAPDLLGQKDGVKVAGMGQSQNELPGRRWGMGPPGERRKHRSR